MTTHAGWLIAVRGPQIRTAVGANLQIKPVWSFFVMELHTSAVDTRDYILSTITVPTILVKSRSEAYWPRRIGAVEVWHRQNQRWRVRPLACTYPIPTCLSTGYLDR